MAAKKVFHQKKRYSDGSIVEMKMWQMNPTTDKPHGLKYSLVYIENGRRVIGYDNADRRGDHRHYGERVERYGFNDVDRLLEDFLIDIMNWRKKK